MDKPTGRPMDGTPMPDYCADVLRALAAAETDGLPRPNLPQLVAATGLTTKGTARYALLLLSDRRLIDGHGTPRHLTEAGWKVIEATAEAAAP